MKIGFYQFRPLFGKTKSNLSKIIKALHNVDADLIVLPELALTGYNFSGREEAVALGEDPEQSMAVAALTQLCRQQDLHIVIGFAEKKQDKLFNSALLIGANGLVHTYRKIHLFNEEKNCFDPGDTPLALQEVKGTKIGMMICFDWVFPEVCRSLALQGAHIICHPSNLVLNYCQQTMLSRCLENSVFAVTTNRFGSDRRPHGEVRFTGKSQIVAPKGKLLHRALSQRQALFITEIDPVQAEDKSMTALNDLFADRRPEFYSVLTACE